jgi:hypothetical protein
LVIEHTNRANALLEHARVNRMGDVQMMMQMQTYDQVFRDGFFEFLTPVQIGKYDAVSKKLLSNFYLSGEDSTTGLHRLIMLIEHVDTWEPKTASREG